MERECKGEAWRKAWFDSQEVEGQAEQQREKYCRATVAN
jgi:hypothetical protein